MNLHTHTHTNTYSHWNSLQTKIEFKKLNGWILKRKRKSTFMGCVCELHLNVMHLCKQIVIKGYLKV